ncbi:MAG: low molecular weight phosphotyrosine protein phosphatase [Saprospiraceae bacterium]|nr:low molecular weight phosphotyrosine protein phosphatase [Saprospiraceae bacterium]MBK9220949.1 low molecular weight phosphotyrosine protein phosphatase [Saprospiraceae bacterium]MBK9722206.1 low molecular weight phosphotyrosine protein phosphatase [Saprospiraceae bacterium]MBK9729227.1 low molecular weight phosphotyrosine protein phosphatase [Saprospiraceae bacterium]
MKILMICAGNICRSPMAQGVMEALIAKNGLNWTVDSAGTNGYHDGECPDPRAIREIRTIDIEISHQISRKIKQQDLDQYELLFAMDLNNLKNLHAMSPQGLHRSKIHLLMDFAYPGKNISVPDPYYDNRFKDALRLIQIGCQAIIANFNKN